VGKAGWTVTVNDRGYINIVKEIQQDIEPLVTNRVIRPVDEFEVNWSRDFYSAFHDKYGEETFNLVIELFGKAVSGKNQTREAIGFVSIQLNLEDGKIAYGRHILQLCTNPITFVESDKTELPEEYIAISILDPFVVKTNLADERVKDPVAPPTPVSE